MGASENSRWDEPASTITTRGASHFGGKERSEGWKSVSPPPALDVAVAEVQYMYTGSTVCVQCSCLLSSVCCALLHLSLIWEFDC